MVDRKNNEKDLWLEEDTPSPEAAQSRRNIHRFVTANHVERTKAKIYATGNKWAIENFESTH